MNRFYGAKTGMVRLLSIVLLSVVGSSIALAQVSGSMSGKIEDSSGAAVPGANVTVTSLETGTARTVMADSAGKYQVLALPVGRYEVKAENAGFKAAVQTGINLVVGQQAVVNLKLEVGAVQEQVTVTSDAPLINTTTSSIAGLVGEKQVKELPLNGRSFDLLLALNPGTVNMTAGKASGPANAGVGGNLFSVAGRRSIENLTLMNGIEYTGSGNQSVSPDGASGYLLGIDAVREYNVVTDTYGAEYGQRAGAHVSVVTQSGTNQLHGTVFEFLRNDKLNGRDFFAQGVPPFKRNQFGGALGGPIRKNKTFIFGNYEGFRQASATPAVTIVPDANFRQGFLPCGSSGYPACAAGAAVGTPTLVPKLDTRMLAFVQTQWPTVNGPNLGGGAAESFGNFSQPITQNFGTMRVDHTLSDKDLLSSTYTIDDGYNQYPAGDPLFAFGVTIRNQVFSVQENHIFSPNVVNTFTTGYSRANYFNVNTTLTPFPASLDFVTGLLPGAINVGNVNSLTGGGITASGNQNPFVHFVRNLFTATDSLQVVRGKHQFSFGGWFERVQNNDDDPLKAVGTATFSSFQTLLQGTVSTFSVAPQTVEDGWRSWFGAWYAQDTIQLRSNLTLRVGIRHEFSNGWSEVEGKAQSYLFNQGVIQTLPRTSSEFNTQNNSKWLFSPRIGLAWDPFGKGRTSIRAGFGTYYDLEDYLGYFVDTTPPLNGTASYSNVSLFSIIPINPSAPLLPPCSAGVPPSQCIIYQPKSNQSDYKVPTVEEWNLSLEQQLSRNTALRVAYLGSHSYHQWVTIDPNTIPAQICSNAAGCLAGGVNAARTTVAQGTEYIPAAATGTTTRPNPFLGSGFFMESYGVGNYDALQVEVNQRLAQGLVFRTNFSWAKGLDLGSGTVGGGTGSGTQALVTDNRQEYSLSGFSIAAAASANLSYALPFGNGKPWLNGVHGVADKLVSGWQLNTIVTLRSGLPIPITVGGGNPSGNGDGNNDDRPNLLPGFSGNPTSGTTAGCGGIIPAGQQLATPNRWYNPCAFAIPAAGTFGNLARATAIGPGLATLDVSLFKNTKISERVGLQFRAEAFNLLNHPNFLSPSGSVFTGTSVNPQAGVILSTATNARQIQFGLKLIF